MTWCVAVYRAVSFGVLQCGVALRCWVRGVLCCCVLCPVLLRPVVLCRNAPCAVLRCAVLARLCRAPVLCSVASVALRADLWCCLWFLFVRRRASSSVVASSGRLGALVSLAGLVGALLLLVVCCGALLPCAVSCGAVRLCGAVLLCPAVCFARLLVFVCSVPLLKPVQILLKLFSVSQKKNKIILHPTHMRAARRDHVCVNLRVAGRW